MKRQSKRRVKLLFTFVAMVITFCMACFGVFAATNIAYDGSGSFVFSVGENVATRITGSYKNADNSVTGPIKFTDRRTEGFDEEGTFTLDGTNTDYMDGSMQFPSLSFASIDDVYTYTFNVTNDLLANDLNVKFTYSVNNPDYLTLGTPTYTIDGAPIELTNGFAVVAPAKTVVFTITIKPTNNASTLESGFTSGIYTFGLTVQRAD